MRVLLSSHTLAISSTCEVWFPVNRGERNESRIAVTPDPSVFLEGLARETSSPAWLGSPLSAVFVNFLRPD